jgi:hypothetical protein
LRIKVTLNPVPLRVCAAPLERVTTKWCGLQGLLAKAGCYASQRNEVTERQHPTYCVEKVEQQLF